jgi:hypothetical protein
MFDCNKLIHPFQTEAGCSQTQRVMNDLLSGAAQIDGRTLAQLLQYFTQLAPHISYRYADAVTGQLQAGDWQPFFSNSTPFVLSSIAHYDTAAITDKFNLYNSLFEKRPTPAGLQLLLHYFYYNTIYRINSWYTRLQQDELPVVPLMEKLVKGKIQPVAIQFIRLMYAASRLFCIRQVDCSCFFAETGIWNMQQELFYNQQDGEVAGAPGNRRQQLLNLQQQLKDQFALVLQQINMITTGAATALPQSLLAAGEGLRQKHTPHLALVFVFLRLFQQLQGQLNGFTRQHLDFFYKEVLQLKEKEAVPDKVHIVFEIQKQLKQYALKKGLLVKDGKDNNKADILFALDDEIVVNQARVTGTRTLFLNNQSLYDTSYLEGVYIAPDATKADGLAIDFPAGAPASFPTAGSKYSRYTAPDQTTAQPYPAARLGFILASPVLLLHEGRRTIRITLACELKQPKDSCPGGNGKEYPNVYDPKLVFNKIKKLIGKSYVHLRQDLIAEAAKKGLSAKTVEALQQLLEEDKEACGTTVKHYLPAKVFTAGEWYNRFYKNLDKSEQPAIDSLFKPVKLFKVLFSGTKDWLEASKLKRIAVTSLATDASGKTTFSLKIKAILLPDKEPVGFYDKEKLKEDYPTRLPLVKIELNDFVKIWKGFDLPEQPCCLYRKKDSARYPLSFYHFFRHVHVIESTLPDEHKQVHTTGIHVQVCNVKNIVVQNDDGLQDVNTPVYPFGTRPVVQGFDMNDPDASTDNNRGPNFYIGSMEVFCKKWETVRVNLNWKDKPLDFGKYYRGYTITGLKEENFKMQIGALQDGVWQEEAGTRGLFAESAADVAGLSTCADAGTYMQSVWLEAGKFPAQGFSIENTVLNKWDVNARNGFIRLGLRRQDFLHKNYAFVLARQMMAFGKLPDNKVEGAVYYDQSGDPVVINTNLLIAALGKSAAVAQKAHSDTNTINAKAGLINEIPDSDAVDIRGILRNNNVPNTGDLSLVAGTSYLDDTLNNDVQHTLDAQKKFEAIIPNEPWTPVISGMSIDYTAVANMTDITLIHLYPFEGTYKQEEIQLQPPLFPVFCDEGNLFISLSNLVPGSNISLLFQLAEATANTEADPEPVFWQYLSGNQWKDLRPGFEVLDDATHGLTTSGVIRFSLPASITSDNTVMPAGVYWIKASLAKNSTAVSETIGLFAQAVRASFTNDAANDKNRLAQPLKEQSVAKLQVADANVKQVQQPYSSFGGALPEDGGHYYIRISELLRHKGRAVQKFDYERLALEAFPQLFKAKCITHSLGLDAGQYKNDFPLAPGYVLLALIPDLNKLAAAQSFEPKLPASLIETITAYLRQRTSPFVRLKVMNPRYEKINFCLSVVLVKGKDSVYYRERLKQDLREFLAPWAVGQYDKLTFGECVNRSDIIRFLETREYIDYITRLQMSGEADNQLADEICPVSPRSILIAGDIQVTIEEDHPSAQRESDCHTVYGMNDYCKISLSR